MSVCPVSQNRVAYHKHCSTPRRANYSNAYRCGSAPVPVKYRQSSVKYRQSSFHRLGASPMRSPQLILALRNGKIEGERVPQAIASRRRLLQKSKPSPEADIRGSEPHASMTTSSLDAASEAGRNLSIDDAIEGGAGPHSLCSLGAVGPVVSSKVLAQVGSGQFRSGQAAIK